jgi:hypothetical protein
MQEGAAQARDIPLKSCPTLASKRSEWKTCLHNDKKAGKAWGRLEDIKIQFDSISKYFVTDRDGIDGIVWKNTIGQSGRPAALLSRVNALPLILMTFSTPRSLRLELFFSFSFSFFFLGSGIFVPFGLSSPASFICSFCSFRYLMVTQNPIKKVYLPLHKISGVKLRVLKISPI